MKKLIRYTVTILVAPFIFLSMFLMVIGDIGQNMMDVIADFSVIFNEWIEND